MTDEEPKRDPAPQPPRRRGGTERMKAALKRERQRNTELQQLLQTAAAQRIESGTATYDGVTYVDGEPAKPPEQPLHTQLRELGREEQVRRCLRHFDAAQLQTVRRNLVKAGHVSGPVVDLLSDRINELQQEV